VVSSTEECNETTSSTEGGKFLNTRRLLISKNYSVPCSLELDFVTTPSLFYVSQEECLRDWMCML
jgi:hypothetical protein